MIEQLLSMLKEARNVETQASEAYRKEVDKYAAMREADPAYKLAESALGEAKKLVDELDTQIRQAALEQYRESGNKSPHPKVTVKIFKVVKTKDEKAAREWCFTNLRTALKLDSKTWEKSVKDSGLIPDDLAEVVEEPRAQIASEL